MPEVFRTRDPVASIKKAYEDYTHVVAHRAYQTLRPVFFRSAEIRELPIFVYQHWQSVCAVQARKWRADGGVILDLGFVEGIGPRDVTVAVEMPMTLYRLEEFIAQSTEQVVIDWPVSWQAHEHAISTKTPTAATAKRVYEKLKEMRAESAEVAAVTRHPESKMIVTGELLALATGMPLIDILFLRNAMGADDVYCARTHIAPDAPKLRAVWDALEQIEPGWTGQRVFTKLLDSVTGWRKALKEMARLGNITLHAYHVYPEEEPPYAKLQRENADARANLQAVQRLLESAPWHLPSPQPSGESP